MEEIKEKLINMLQELVGEDAEISEDLGFFDMGISSLLITTFCIRIQEEFEIECDESVIFNYSNIEELAEYISEQN